MHQWGPIDHLARGHVLRRSTDALLEYKVVNLNETPPKVLLTVITIPLFLNKG